MEDGIQALIDMENIPLNSPKRDTSKDKEQAIRVAGDLDILKKSPDAAQYKNTITRAETIITVLKGDKSARELAKDLDTVHKKITDWIKVYNAKGIDGLKDMENIPITKTKKGESYDEELTKNLSSDIKQLKAEKDKYPNTIARLKAIKGYAQGKTIELIASKTGVASTPIKALYDLYKAEGIDAIKKKENYSINKIVRNTSNDDKLAKTLSSQISDLSKNNNEHKEFIKMLKTVLRVLKHKEQIRDIAHSVHREPKTIRIWVNAYCNEGGIEKLREIFKPARKRKLNKMSDPQSNRPKGVKQQKNNTGSDYKSKLKKKKRIGLNR